MMTINTSEYVFTRDPTLDERFENGLVKLIIKIPTSKSAAKHIAPKE